MPEFYEYRRPADLAGALALLQQQGKSAVPLAGGTWLTPRLGQTVNADMVLDLQRLGLDTITQSAAGLTIGAMVTLQSIAEHEICRTLCGGLLATTARRDAPINLRNIATIGGTVAVAPPDSELILALLACNAEVNLVSATQDSWWRLADLLAAGSDALDKAVITQLLLPTPAYPAAGVARVSRTPADHPIVCAVVALASRHGATRVVLNGVSPRPLLIEMATPDDLEAAVSQQISSAEPLADFRGSAAYRREMGLVLARRALAEALASLEEG